MPDSPQQFYLRDADTGDRVPRQQAVPGHLYEVRYDAGGAQAGESRWGWYRVGQGGHEEFQAEAESPGGGSAADVAAAGWRGIKHGSRTIYDLARHGIPALSGDEESVAGLVAATDESRRAYELETPLRDQVAARQPLFGKGGRLSAGRIAGLGGEAIPWLGAFISTNWALAGAARVGAAGEAATAASTAGAAGRVGKGAQRLAGGAVSGVVGGQVRRGAIAGAGIGGVAAGGEGIQRAVDGGSQAQDSIGAGRIAAGIAGPVHAVTGGILGPVWNRGGAGIPKIALETLTEAVEGGTDEFAAQAATRQITLQPYDLRQILEGAGLEAIGGGVAAAGAQSVQGIAIKGFDKWLEKKEEDSGGSQAQKESQYQSFAGLLFGKAGEGGTDFINPSRTPESLGPRGGTEDEALEIFSALPENTPPAEAEARKATTKKLWTQLLALEKSLPKGVSISSFVGGATAAELMNGSQIRDRKIPGLSILADFGLRADDEISAQKIKEDFLTSVAGQVEAASDPHLRQVWDVMRYALEPSSVGDSIVVNRMNQLITERWGAEYAILGENIAAADDAQADLPTKNVLRRLSAMVRLARISKQEKEAGRESLVDFHQAAYKQATGRGRDSAPFQWLLNAHQELKQSPAYRAAARNMESVRPVARAVDAADMLDILEKTHKMAEEIEARASQSPEGKAAAAASQQPSSAPPDGGTQTRPIQLRQAESEAALLMSLQASFGARTLNAAPMNLRVGVGPVPDLAVPRRTKRGKIDGKFSPDRSGVIVIYEDSNRNMFLAHGLARYQAAVEREQAGDRVSIPAVVFRAADGVTHEDMAAIADILNIASGRASAPEIAAAMLNPKISEAVAAAVGMADSRVLKDVEAIHGGLTPEQIDRASVKGIPDRMVAAVAASKLTPEQKTAALAHKDAARAQTTAAAQAVIDQVGKTEKPAAAKPKPTPATGDKKPPPGKREAQPQFAAPPKSKVGEEAAAALTQEYFDSLRRHAYRQLTDQAVRRAALRDLQTTKNVSQTEQAILQAIFALDSATREQAAGNVPSSNERWRKIFRDHGGGSIQRGFRKPGGNKELRDLRRAIGLFWVAREAQAMGLDTASSLRVMGMFGGGFDRGPGQAPLPFNTSPGFRAKDGIIYLAMSYVDPADNVQVDQIGNIAEFFSHESWHVFFDLLPRDQQVRLHDDAKQWLRARGHTEQFIESQVQESLRMAGYKPPQPLGADATAEAALAQQQAIDKYKKNVADERLAYTFQFAIHHGFQPVRPPAEGIGALTRELFSSINRRFLRLGWLDAEQAINALYRGSARDLMARKEKVGSARALRRALRKPVPGRRDIVRVQTMNDLVVAVGDQPEEVEAAAPDGTPEPFAAAGNFVSGKLPSDVVRGKDGQPLKVYHGTAAKFDRYKRWRHNMDNPADAAARIDLGVHFTPDIEVARVAAVVKLARDGGIAYRPSQEEEDEEWRSAQEDGAEIKQQYLRGNVYVVSDDAGDWTNHNEILRVVKEQGPHEGADGFPPLPKHIAEGLELQMTEGMRNYFLKHSVDILAYPNKVEGLGELSFVVMNPFSILSRTGKRKGETLAMFAAPPPAKGIDGERLKPWWQDLTYRRGWKNDPRMQGVDKNVLDKDGIPRLFFRGMDNAPADGNFNDDSSFTTEHGYASIFMWDDNENGTVTPVFLGAKNLLDARNSDHRKKFAEIYGKPLADGPLDKMLPQFDLDDQGIAPLVAAGFDGIIMADFAPASDTDLNVAWEFRIFDSSAIINAEGGETMSASPKFAAPARRYHLVLADAIAGMGDEIRAGLLREKGRELTNKGKIKPIEVKMMEQALGRAGDDKKVSPQQIAAAMYRRANKFAISVQSKRPKRYKSYRAGWADEQFPDYHEAVYNFKNEFARRRLADNPDARSLRTYDSNHFNYETAFWSRVQDSKEERLVLELQSDILSEQVGRGFNESHPEMEALAKNYFWRSVREEIARAKRDGKKKILFPTPASAGVIQKYREFSALPAERFTTRGVFDESIEYEDEHAEEIARIQAAALGDEVEYEGETWRVVQNRETGATLARQRDGNHYRSDWVSQEDMDNMIYDSTADWVAGEMDSLVPDGSFNLDTFRGNMGNEKYRNLTKDQIIEIYQSLEAGDESVMPDEQDREDFDVALRAALTHEHEPDVHNYLGQGTNFNEYTFAEGEVWYLIDPVEENVQFPAAPEPSLDEKLEEIKNPVDTRMPDDGFNFSDYKATHTILSNYKDAGKRLLRDYGGKIRYVGPNKGVPFVEVDTDQADDTVAMFAAPTRMRRGSANGVWEAMGKPPIYFEAENFSQDVRVNKKLLAEQRESHFPGLSDEEWAWVRQWIEKYPAVIVSPAAVVAHARAMARPRAVINNGSELWSGRFNDDTPDPMFAAAMPTRLRVADLIESQFGRRTVNRRELEVAIANWRANGRIKEADAEVFGDYWLHRVRSKDSERGFGPAREIAEELREFAHQQWDLQGIHNPGRKYRDWRADYADKKFPRYAVYEFWFPMDNPAMLRNHPDGHKSQHFDNNTAFWVRTQSNKNELLVAEMQSDILSEQAQQKPIHAGMVALAKDYFNLMAMETLALARRQKRKAVYFPTPYAAGNVQEYGGFVVKKTRENYNELEALYLADQNGIVIQWNGEERLLVGRRRRTKSYDVTTERYISIADAAEEFAKREKDIARYEKNVDLPGSFPDSIETRISRLESDLHWARVTNAGRPLAYAIFLTVADIIRDRWGTEPDMDRWTIVRTDAGLYAYEGQPHQIYAESRGTPNKNGFFSPSVLARMSGSQRTIISNYQRLGRRLLSPEFGGELVHIENMPWIKVGTDKAKDFRPMFASGKRRTVVQAMPTRLRVADLLDAQYGNRTATKKEMTRRVDEWLANGRIKEADRAVFGEFISPTAIGGNEPRRVADFTAALRKRARELWGIDRWAEETDRYSSYRAAYADKTHPYYNEVVFKFTDNNPTVRRLDSERKRFLGGGPYASDHFEPDAAFWVRRQQNSKEALILEMQSDILSEQVMQKRLPGGTRPQMAALARDYFNIMAMETLALAKREGRDTVLFPTPLAAGNIQTYGGFDLKAARISDEDRKRIQAVARGDEVEWQGSKRMKLGSLEPDRFANITESDVYITRSEMKREIDKRRAEIDRLMENFATADREAVASEIDLAQQIARDEGENIATAPAWQKYGKLAHALLYVGTKIGHAKNKGREVWRFKWNKGLYAWTGDQHSIHFYTETGGQKSVGDNDGFLSDDDFERIGREQRTIIKNYQRLGRRLLGPEFGGEIVRLGDAPWIRVSTDKAKDFRPMFAAAPRRRQPDVISDRDGNPVVFYHGTVGIFDKLRRGRDVKRFGNRMSGFSAQENSDLGVHFALSENTARTAIFHKKIGSTPAQFFGREEIDVMRQDGSIWKAHLRGRAFYVEQDAGDWRDAEGVQEALLGEGGRASSMAMQEALDHWGISAQAIPVEVFKKLAAVDIHRATDADPPRENRTASAVEKMRQILLAGGVDIIFYPNSFEGQSDLISAVVLNRQSIRDPVHNNILSDRRGNFVAPPRPRPRARRQADILPGNGAPIIAPNPALPPDDQRAAILAAAAAGPRNQDGSATIAATPASRDAAKFFGIDAAAGNKIVIPAKFIEAWDAPTMRGDHLRGRTAPAAATARRVAGALAALPEFSPAAARGAAAQILRASPWRGGPPRALAQWTMKWIGGFKGTSPAAAAQQYATASANFAAGLDMRLRVADLIDAQFGNKKVSAEALRAAVQRWQENGRIKMGDVSAVEDYLAEHKVGSDPANVMTQKLRQAAFKKWGIESSPAAEKKFRTFRADYADSKFPKYEEIKFNFQYNPTIAQAQDDAAYSSEHFDPETAFWARAQSNRRELLVLEMQSDIFAEQVPSRPFSPEMVAMSKDYFSTMMLEVMNLAKARGMKSVLFPTPLAAGNVQHYSGFGINESSNEVMRQIKDTAPGDVIRGPGGQVMKTRRNENGYVFVTEMENYLSRADIQDILTGDGSRLNENIALAKDDGGQWVAENERRTQNFEAARSWLFDTNPDLSPRESAAQAEAILRIIYDEISDRTQTSGDQWKVLSDEGLFAHEGSDHSFRINDDAFDFENGFLSEADLEGLSHKEKPIIKNYHRLGKRLLTDEFGGEIVNIGGRDKSMPFIRVSTDKTPATRPLFAAAPMRYRIRVADLIEAQFGNRTVSDGQVRSAMLNWRRNGRIKTADEAVVNDYMSDFISGPGGANFVGRSLAAAVRAQAIARWGVEPFNHGKSKYRSYRAQFADSEFPTYGEVDFTYSYTENPTIGEELYGSNHFAYSSMGWVRHQGNRRDEVLLVELQSDILSEQVPLKHRHDVMDAQAKKYFEILLDEALHYFKQKGKKTVLFPTPLAVGVIQGYGGFEKILKTLIGSPATGIGPNNDTPINDILNAPAGSDIFWNGRRGLLRWHGDSQTILMLEADDTQRNFSTEHFEGVVTDAKIKTEVKRIMTLEEDRAIIKIPDAWKNYIASALKLSGIDTATTHGLIDLRFDEDASVLRLPRDKYDVDRLSRAFATFNLLARKVRAYDNRRRSFAYYTIYYDYDLTPSGKFFAWHRESFSERIDRRIARGFSEDGMDYEIGNGPSSTILKHYQKAGRRLLGEEFGGKIRRVGAGKGVPFIEVSTERVREYRPLFAAVPWRLRLADMIEAQFGNRPTRMNEFFDAARRWRANGRLRAAEFYLLDQYYDSKLQKELTTGREFADGLRAWAEQNHGLQIITRTSNPQFQNYRAEFLDKEFPDYAERVYYPRRADSFRLDDSDIEDTVLNRVMALGHTVLRSDDETLETIDNDEIVSAENFDEDANRNLVSVGLDDDSGYYDEEDIRRWSAEDFDDLGVNFPYVSEHFRRDALWWERVQDSKSRRVVIELQSDIFSEQVGRTIPFRWVEEGVEDHSPHPLMKDLAKNYFMTMVYHAIERAKRDKKKSVLFPTPLSAAIVQGYSFARMERDRRLQFSFNKDESKQILSAAAGAEVEWHGQTLIKLGASDDTVFLSPFGGKYFTWEQLKPEFKKSGVDRIFKHFQAGGKPDGRGRNLRIITPADGVTEKTKSEPLGRNRAIADHIREILKNKTDGSPFNWTVYETAEGEYAAVRGAFYTRMPKNPESQFAQDGMTLDIPKDRHDDYQKTILDHYKTAGQKLLRDWGAKIVHIGPGQGVPFVEVPTSKARGYVPMFAAPARLRVADMLEAQFGKRTVLISDIVGTAEKWRANNRIKQAELSIVEDFSKTETVLNMIVGSSHVPAAAFVDEMRTWADRTWGIDSDYEQVGKGQPNSYIQHRAHYADRDFPDYRVVIFNFRDTPWDDLYQEEDEAIERVAGQEGYFITSDMDTDHQELQVVPSGWAMMGEDFQEAQEKDPKKYEDWEHNESGDWFNPEEEQAFSYAIPHPVEVEQMEYHSEHFGRDTAFWLRLQSNKKSVMVLEMQSDILSEQVGGKKHRYGIELNETHPHPVMAEYARNYFQMMMLEAIELARRAGKESILFPTPWSAGEVQGFSGFNSYDAAVPAEKEAIRKAHAGQEVKWGNQRRMVRAPYNDDSVVFAEGEYISTQKSAAKFAEMKDKMAQWEKEYNGDTKNLMLDGLASDIHRNTAGISFVEAAPRAYAMIRAAEEIIGHNNLMESSRWHLNYGPDGFFAFEGNPHTIYIDNKNYFSDDGFLSKEDLAEMRESQATILRNYQRMGRRLLSPEFGGKIVKVGPAPWIKVSTDKARGWRPMFAAGPGRQVSEQGRVFNGLDGTARVDGVEGRVIISAEEVARHFNQGQAATAPGEQEMFDAALRYFTQSGQLTKHDDWTDIGGQWKMTGKATPAPPEEFSWARQMPFPQMIPPVTGRTAEESTAPLFSAPPREALDENGKYDPARDKREFAVINGHTIFKHFTQRHFRNLRPNSDGLIWFADDDAEDAPVLRVADSIMTTRQGFPDLPVRRIRARLIGRVFNAREMLEDEAILLEWADIQQTKWNGSYHRDFGYDHAVFDYEGGDNPTALFSAAQAFGKQEVFQRWLRQHYPEYDIIVWDDTHDVTSYTVFSGAQVVNYDTGETMAFNRERRRESRGGQRRFDDPLKKNDGNGTPQGGSAV